MIDSSQNEDTRTLTGWRSDRGCLASLGMGELPHVLTHQAQRRLAGLSTVRVYSVLHLKSSDYWFASDSMRCLMRFYISRLDGPGQDLRWEDTMLEDALWISSGTSCY